MSVWFLLGALTGAVGFVFVHLRRRRFQRECVADGVCPRCAGRDLKPEKVLDWRVRWQPGVKCYGCYSEFQVGFFDVPHRIEQARKEAAPERVAEALGVVEKDRWN